MDANNAIVIDAQRKIIADLAIWELKMSELYELYANMFPSIAVEWRKLASEEKLHAAMLKTLNQQLDRGETFDNIGSFRKEFVAEHLSHVEEALHNAKTKVISVAESLRTSLRLESSMVESRFYKTVGCKAPEFAIICNKLAQCLEAHVAAINDLVVEHLGKNLTYYDR